jgi:bleomycin hydrolase
MMVIDSALYNGYSLVWDGDISEYPLINNNQIDYSINVLDLPTELNQSQCINHKLRQNLFDNYTTTEDHLSHLVGIAKDKSGNKYYILKDSQGANKFLNGYIYLSDSYVKLKTISILAHREILEKVVKK